MKFLIIQTAFIGDVILASALVEKLHRFYPEADIDFLLRRGNESLLNASPHIKRIWVWDKKKEKYKGLLRLIQDVRKERYDAAINCQRFAASGLLTVLSGAKTTIGFDKNPFSRLFSQRVKHQIGNKEKPIHEVERNLALIRRLTDDSFEMPRLYPSADDFEKAAQHTNGTPYVCIAPTSVWHTKQWPQHKWAELIAALPGRFTVFLLGAPADRPACDDIIRAAGRENAYNIAGQLSLLQSAALMKGATMNYANDSAPIHMASALNAPMTAVFCSTVPVFGFTPLSENGKVVETAENLRCRPCGLHGRRMCPEGHFACAESIPIEKLLIA